MENMHCHLGESLNITILRETKNKLKQHSKREREKRTSNARN
jgi:hypothetical protein